MRKPLLVAVAVSLAVAAVTYLASPLVASAVSGLNCLSLSLLAVKLRPLWQPLLVRLREARS